MEEEEHSRYVAQLKAEFDSCDTTATGFLDREELSALCHKLHLETHLPLLLDHLLGGRGYSCRVNFQEFKEGFVAVLSRSLDLSTSEEDSSYLEPVADEVKPKFVKGSKRYGRWSRPDSLPEPPRHTHASPSAVRQAKLRRSTSLESVESLKSDDETGSQKERESQTSCPTPGFQQDMMGGGIKQVWEEVCVTCDDTQDLNGLSSHTPLSSSTPRRPHDPQRTPQRQVSPAPCQLTTVGPRLLSQLSDASGNAASDHVIALWAEEGLHHGLDVLQMLEFPLEGRLSLAELSLALENELLSSGNTIHQAALVCYRAEILHLQLQAHQASQERDRLRVEVEQAERRTLHLVREVDDRHATMETLNHSRIRGLEQEFRDRLTALRSQSEQESEVLLLQGENERAQLSEEVDALRTHEDALRDELDSTLQDNKRLEEEVCVLRLKLSEAENNVSRIQNDLEHLLEDKVGSTSLSQEDHLSELRQDYELQCRDLRDRNDELISQLEVLRNQVSAGKSRHTREHCCPLDWAPGQDCPESDTEELEAKQSSPPSIKKKLPAVDENGLVSIETELMMERLREQHSQEVQDLKIQLETKVNFYERSLELLRQNMETERKDIAQSFKLEISELEEQKARAEAQVVELKGSLEKLQGGGAYSPEQERRLQRERTELEQSYVREISHLVQRLSAEKEQLEVDLKLQRDQEVMRVREESEEQVIQVKLQSAESQRHLLHREQQLLQEQQSSWESQRLLLEQEISWRGGKPLTGRSTLEQHREEEVKSCLRSTGEELGRSRSSQESLRAALEEEREEAGRLSLEKEHYARLADQLSTQILEMEAELDTKGAELDAKVAELEAKWAELEAKETVLNAKGVELNARGVALEAKEAWLDSEGLGPEAVGVEKRLLHMERLVLALEEELHLDAQRRSQLEEVQSECSILKDRLSVSQEDVQRLEDDVSRRKRKVEELEREHEKRREEEERLHKENSRYREEVLQLSSRNLDLSAQNAELSARLRGDEGAVNALQERLAEVTREKEEGVTKVRGLEEGVAQLERDRQQQQTDGQRERDLLEREMEVCREQLQRCSTVEAELKALSLKHEWSERDKNRLQTEAQQRNTQVQQLQAALISAEARLQAVTQEGHAHKQEAANKQARLQEALQKVEQMEASMVGLRREQQQEVGALQEQKESLLLKLSELQEQDEEVRRLNQECLTLRSNQSLLVLGHAHDQAVRVDAASSLMQEQCRQEVQEARQEVQEATRMRVEEERRRGQQEEERLRLQLSLQHQQHQQVVSSLQDRLQEVETKLQSLRLLLQDKVDQLKDQMVKTSRSGAQLKELHVENSQLMKALQVTEQRQKKAEKKNFLLEEKVSALNTLLRDIVSASLAT